MGMRITTLSSIEALSGLFSWSLYSSTKSMLYCLGCSGTCFDNVKTESPKQFTVTTRSPLECNLLNHQSDSIWLFLLTISNSRQCAARCETRGSCRTRGNTPRSSRSHLNVEFLGCAHARTWWLTWILRTFQSTAFSSWNSLSGRSSSFYGRFATRPILNCCQRQRPAHSTPRVSRNLSGWKLLGSPSRKVHAIGNLGRFPILGRFSGMRHKRHKNPCPTIEKEMKVKKICWRKIIFNDSLETPWRNLSAFYHPDARRANKCACLCSRKFL